MTDDVARAGRCAEAAYASFTPDVVRLEGATLLRTPSDPDVPMVNRVVGLGVEAPATADLLNEVVTGMAGLTHYVAVAPDAGPAALTGWLSARGYEPGWGWMLFTRPAAGPPPGSAGVEVVGVDGATEEAFRSILAQSYGLSQATADALPIVGNAAWTCLVALVDGVPAGTGAVYVLERAAYLGFAATLPEHRGRGAQSALLASRIALARDLGCDLVVTETGERLPDRPSASYRNILRAGFHEAHVVANWLRRR